MTMKPFEFLLLPIVQLLIKFHCNTFTNEVEGDNFPGLTLSISQIIKAQFFLKKVAKLQTFCKCVLQGSVI